MSNEYPMNTAIQLHVNVILDLFDKDKSGTLNKS